MKRSTTLYLAILIGIPLAAQQVVSAGGQEHVHLGRSLTFTLGEPVHTTAVGTSAVLTQGFNQPWAEINTGVDDPMDDPISVYPNPTRHVLYVDHKAHREGERYALFNAAGALLLEGALNGQITTLDMERFASGGYLLNLHGPDKKTLRTFKISITR